MTGNAMSAIEKFNQKIYPARDAKTIPHLAQYAPVWIIDQKLVPEDSSIQFSVMFFHKLYGWVNRRYRFDGFNNTLYHKGQVLLSEEEALDIVESKEPYINATVADTPNAYGG